MQYRLYLLAINELEDVNLKNRALLLMDSYRKEKVYKYKGMKDQLHQIATGLLLQVGVLELEIPGKQSEEIYICNAGEVVDFLEDYNASQTRKELKIPIEIDYGKGEHGKPFWQWDFLQKLPIKKEFTHFNISHSGDYVALVICNDEIGVDLQKERETKYEGGCTAFSRMEAYVKYTGEGYAKGVHKYNNLNGDISDVCFCRKNVLKDYVIWICYLK